MDRDSHIELLKKLIEQNKAALTELQRTLADLEDRRHASVERHSISPGNHADTVTNRAPVENSSGN